MWEHHKKVVMLQQLSASISAFPVMVAQTILWLPFVFISKSGSVVNSISYTLKVFIKFSLGKRETQRGGKQLSVVGKLYFEFLVLWHHYLYSKQHQYQLCLAICHHGHATGKGQLGWCPNWVGKSWLKKEQLLSPWFHICHPNTSVLHISHSSARQCLLNEAFRCNTWYGTYAWVSFGPNWQWSSVSLVITFPFAHTKAPTTKWESNITITAL